MRGIHRKIWAIFGSGLNFIAYFLNSEDQKNRIDAAKLALVTIFRSWPGNALQLLSMRFIV